MRNRIFREMYNSSVPDDNVRQQLAERIKSERRFTGYGMAALSAAAVLIICIGSVIVMGQVKAPSEIAYEKSDTMTSHSQTVTSAVNAQTEEAVTSPVDMPFVTSYTEISGVIDHSSENESSDEYVSEPTAVPLETETVTAEITADTAVSEELSSSAEIQPETAVIPRWEEIPESERYNLLSIDGREYHLSDNEIDAEKLTFYRNGEICGYDEYGMELRTVECAYYRIEGMSEEYAVAVFVADGSCRSFINPLYLPPTLGEYLDGTDYLSRRAEGVTSNEALFDKETEEFYTIIYTLPDADKAVKEMLLSQTAAPLVVTEPSYELSFFENIIFRIVMSEGVIEISSDGYMRIARVSERYYDIGEDAAERFRLYAEENGAPQRIYLTNTGDNETVPE